MVTQVIQISPFGGITHFEPSRKAGFSLNHSHLGNKSQQRRASNIHRHTDESEAYYIVEVITEDGNPLYLTESLQLSYAVHKSKRFKTRVDAIDAELKFGQGRLKLVGDQSYINTEGVIIDEEF